MHGSGRALAAVFMSFALAMAGWFIGQGFVKSRTADRHVTVKGVSERDVLGDVALWPIQFVATDDDLAVARAAIRRSETSVLAFLERHGIGAAKAAVQAIRVSDALANPYRSGPVSSRYTITQTLMVRTSDAEKLRRASQSVGELIDAGVVLSSQHGPDAGPTYLFTRLNQVKPDMIAEATSRARQAAEKFAEDSGSGIAGIKRANQGVFVVLPRDRAPGVIQEHSLEKTVRVVTTIDYLLD